MNPRSILLKSALAHFFAMLVQSNAAAVLPALMAEWDLSSAQGGVILGAFQAGYVLGILIFGSLADRRSPRRIMALGAAGAGLAGAAFALLAGGLGTAAALRFLAGFSLGGVYLPGLKYLAAIFPPGGRGAAYGVFVASLVVGSGGSLLLAGPLLVWLDWRGAILATSLLALAGAALLATLPDPPAAAAEHAAQIRSLGQRLRAVVSTPGVAVVMLAYIIHTAELYAFWGWVGPFLVDAWGRAAHPRPEAAGNILAGLVVAAGGLGTWLGGRTADRWGRRRTLRWIVALSLAGALVFGRLQPSTPAGLVLLVTVGLVYGVVIVADSAVYSSAVADLLPPSLLGFGLSCQQAVGFGAAALSPVLVGSILGAAGAPGSSGSAAGWPAAFTVIGMGSLVVLLLVGRIRDR